jgi:YidC/Oxa1 family membrane protein insertase
MERRVLLAISLSLGVLFLFQAFYGPKPQAPGTPAANVTSSGPTASTATPPVAGAPAAAAAATAPVPQTPLAVGETDEREITVETTKVRAVFTNRGGRLRHWMLKEYKDDQGRLLDLVPASPPPDAPTPFSLKVEDAAATSRLNESLYRVSGVDGIAVDGASKPVELVFEMETADGLKARKRFGLEPASYIVQFSASVQQGSQTLNPTIEWGPGLGDEIARSAPKSFLSPNYLYRAQAIIYNDGSVERVQAQNLGQGATRDGGFRWAGVDDHYFISAILQPPTPVHLEYVPVTAAVTTTTPPETAHYVSYVVRLPSPPENVRFYVGPKQLDILRGIDPEFTKAIYFGIFRWLAAPLLEGLKWVHEYIGNWGWSIIVLTIFINLAMFPFRHASVKSMRKMQAIQPEMKAIQDRYAQYKITDPERQKMNTEVMELYRTRGVNPASGCVPTLITLPFLFAFYAMLGQAIEIRGQGFLGWIHDLSRADPFYITPLLMGVTMFWQMRLQPTTADPSQQKVMMLMPFMITATMLFAPSGLVIYWLVSNVWGIGQQYLTGYLIGPAKGAGPRSGGASRPRDIVVPPSQDRRGKQ